MIPLGLGLDRLGQLATLLEDRSVRIRPEQCLKTRISDSKCDLCAKACPGQAITWGPRLQVDIDKCAGCGACTLLCPTGALELEKPTADETLVQIKSTKCSGTPLIFACTKQSEIDIAASSVLVRLRCLGRLDAALLLGAVGAGVSRISLLSAGCDECPNRVALEIVAGEVDQANSVLHLLERQVRITIDSKGVAGSDLNEGQRTEDASTASRREFFALLARKTRWAAASTASDALDDLVGTAAGRVNRSSPKPDLMPLYLPARRQRLLQTLKELVIPHVEGLTEADAWAPQLRIKETCSLCQACVVLCPTGALTKTDSDDAVGVAYVPANCTTCGVCRDACLPAALEFAGPVKLTRFLDDRTEVLVNREKADIPWLATPEQLWRKRLRALN